MIPVTGFDGQTVGILGLGRTGLATAQALRAGGATPVAWDDGEAAREAAAGDGITLVDFASEPWPGLACLVVSPGIPHLYPAPHPVIAKAWGEGVPVDNDIGLFFQSCPDAKVVAITGTNGKSTTTALIRHLLAETGRAVQMGGNIGTAVLALNPPSPGETIVLELSSYQIDLARCLTPDIAVFLNLAPDHLDRHGGMGGYFNAKRRLFAVGHPPLSVIGVDEAEGRFLANEMRLGRDPGDSVIAISATRPLGGRGRSVALRDGNLAVIDSGNVVHIVRLADLSPALAGLHNAQNAAAAIAVATTLDVPAAAIAKGLSSYPGLPHRMQPVGRLGPVRIINDSKATNPEAAAQSIASFDQVLWIGGGQAKEAGLGALEDELHRIRHAYLIGAAMEDLATALEGRVPVTRSGTLDRAVQDAAAEAQRIMKQDPQAGPVLLLAPACASFDQFKDYEHRGRMFMDLVATLDDVAPAAEAVT
ncbi:MAG: UDP-N-acetylmuramoyl-L-alanine--D-glutamate ligase [Pseudomonadota bacterium]